MRQRSRFGFQLPMALSLTVIWILLWGHLGLLEVVGGFVVSTVVLRVFPLPPVQFDGTIRPLAFAKLVAQFVYDLVTASIQVVRIALTFGKQPMNAIIKVPLHARSDLYLTLTAELSSLVPGGLLLEVSREESTL
ncbi:hypothetical protein BH09ACT10_BH09ACT10_17320 [soil metagenome]